MKIFSTYLIIALSLLTSENMMAQNVTVDAIWKDKQVILNGHKLDRNSGIENIHRIIGMESRMLTDPAEPTKLLIYDSLGINIIIDTATLKIKKIDVYCSKGRREFETSPKKLFNGDLKINGQSLKNTTTPDQLKASTSLPFDELAPGYYWYLAENEEFNNCVAYTNSQRATIGMVYFLMDSKSE